MFPLRPALLCLCVVLIGSTEAADDGATLGIDWLRVCKVVGVAIVVTLLVTLLAPLPVYVVLYLCGCFKTSDSNRRYLDDHFQRIGCCCLPRDCSENNWAPAMIYLGTGSIIGITCGILAAWYSW